MTVQTQAIAADLDLQTVDSSWKSLFHIAGISAWILFFYSLVTMVILVVIGGQPATAQEGFAMLQENRLTGLLRLDILSILIMPLYYLLFTGLYAALKPANPAYALLSTVLLFAGVTLFLATPSAFSWLALNDKFAAATSAADKAQLLAAGEAILASDMWHGSGALVGGLLLQSGAVMVSVVMLGSRSFGRLTAYLGIVMHGLDLLHVLASFFSPVAGLVLMGAAGPLYLVWFPLLARDLFRLARSFQRESA